MGDEKLNGNVLVGKLNGTINRSPTAKEMWDIALETYFDLRTQHKFMKS